MLKSEGSNSIQIGLVRSATGRTQAVGDGQTAILAPIVEKTSWRQISGPLFRM
jgi:hypothetical protein